MHKAYFIPPLALLGVFTFLHHGAEGKRAETERQRRVTIAEARRIDDARKAEVTRRAAEEASARARERERQVREAAEKKRREAEAIVQHVEGEAATQSAQADRLEQEATAATARLAELRRQRDTVESEAFALARDVEQKRVERRNAELEIQRATLIFIARLDRSPLMNPPTDGPRR